MKIISHRANINGRNKERENKLNAIDECISMGFDVEIDIFTINDKIFLGHDYPVDEITVDYLLLNKNKLWIHLKNIESIDLFITLKQDLNWFWHETDKITLTSFGVPWCYPNTYIETGISVVLNKHIKIPKVYGVCTDYPIEWRYNEF